jgi:hypothetical protein
MVTKVDGIPASGALPPLPTGLSLADPDEKAKYNESIQKVLEAFENRSQIPWFKMAAAFADPGRTGTFGESFGKAMGTIGQAQEEDRARALPIAQMRAQLAGQQYEMSKEEKALNAFAAALGTTPQNLQAGMAGAANNPAMMQRLNAAMPMFYGSPKIMEMAKTLFGQHKDIAQFLLEERKAGMTEADLVAKYGNEIIPMIRGYGNVQGTGAPRPPAGAPQAGAPQAGGQTTQQPEPELTPDQLANRPAIVEPETVIDRSVGTVPPSAREGAPAPIRTATEALGAPKIEADRVISPTGEILAERGVSSIADWSKMKEAALADYNKRKAEDIKFERDQINNASKERSESFAPRIKEVGSINPDEVLKTQGLYDSLDNIVNSDPRVKQAFGLLMKQGAGAAMYELAKNGVRINNFGIGVDAYPAFVKGQPPEVQEKLRQADMILSTIFIQKAKDGKSAFGPSISNSDIITQKEQMASIRDTSKIINSWIAQERAIADHKLDIVDAYGNFVTSAEGTNKKPYQFFNSKEYKDISKKYGQIYRDLALATYGAPK